VELRLLGNPPGALERGFEEFLKGGPKGTLEKLRGGQRGGGEIGVSSPLGDFLPKGWVSKTPRESPVFINGGKWGAKSPRGGSHRGEREGKLPPPAVGTPKSGAPL